MKTSGKSRIRPAFVALAFTATAPLVQADEFAPDRFKGGSSDGFASVGIYRDDSVLMSGVRFWGGAADGHDALTFFKLHVPARGTMISVL